VMSAAKADVEAATRPAATIVFMKFIAGLHLVSQALTPVRLGAVNAAFTKV
jgi:hypothetical protein